MHRGKIYGTSEYPDAGSLQWIKGLSLRSARALECTPVWNRNEDVTDSSGPR